MPRLRRRSEKVVRAAEAVGAWWRGGRDHRARLPGTLGRLSLISACAWAGIQIELPVVGSYLPVKNVLVCLVAVLMIGKTVYDSLYYDRHRS